MRPVAAAELAAELRISKPTAYAALRRLENAGRVQPSAQLRIGKKGPLSLAYDVVTP